MANQPFKVEVDIDVTYDIPSPAFDQIDIGFALAGEQHHYESIWMTKEGPTEFNFVAGDTRLYPPFTDSTKRKVLGLFAVQVSSGTNIVDTGYVVAQMYLDTNSDLDTSITIVSAQNGGLVFACQGEEQDDYRKYPQGTQENIALE